ncbi:MAG: glycoside hydrolase family 88 protein [Calditrichaeota bacterium]|nr:glycoside hydrolase family 88 protein [Calditrichota bacterium]
MRLKKKINKLIFVASLFFFVSHLFSQTPLEIARRVVEKIMRDTNFELELVPQKNVLGLQILDFREGECFNAPRVHFATNSIISKKKKRVLLGISHDAPLKIWINRKLVYENKAGTKIPPREISYNRLLFQDTLRTDLQKGNNEILLKICSGANEGVVFLRPIISTGDLDEDIEFKNKINGEAKWLCLDFPGNDRVKDLKKIFPPETSIELYYSFQGSFYRWYFPRQKILAQLSMPEYVTYRKKPYLDWYYANGAMMMAINDLGNFINDASLKKFVRRYCDFAVEHEDYFRDQYEKQFAFRGSFHRMFRLSMLDDAGAPTLPYVDLYAEQKNENYWKIIARNANYVMKGQVRLADSTFCRPEPEPGTVWADDLFMSAPFLLRMGKITGEQKYFDDAARQVLQFHKYLFNEKEKLFFHGYFDRRKENSVALWGRANGWIAWAISETLLHLPESHENYAVILKIYRKFMSGLAAVQGENGLWHQILDHPESYEETSCTAMFVLAMARGIRNHWLDSSYLEIVRKGWQGLVGKIDADGTVHGICRGTGIGNDLNFYFSRKRFDNAPHGLGAIITAAIEITRLEK